MALQQAARCPQRRRTGKQMQTYLFAGLASLAGLGLAGCGGGTTTTTTSGPPSAAPPPAGMTIQVLHINDAHAHLEAENLALDLDQLGIEQDELVTIRPDSKLFVKYGGYPLLTQALVDAEKKASKGPGFAPPAQTVPVFKVHAGDALTGTLYYSLFKGEADAKLMNEVCFDTFTLGNHEFDDGDANLAQFLEQLTTTPTCPKKPAVLGANVFPGPDSPLKGMIEGSTVIERGGIKLGIVGVDTRIKTMEASRPSEGTVVKDEAEWAQKEIDALTTAGVDHIILVSHIGYANDVVLAKTLKNVDVIIGGDSHSLLAGDQLASMLAGVKTADYPHLAPDTDVCIVQSWQYTHLLGKLIVEFDAGGKVTRCSGSPVAPYDQGSLFQRYSVSDNVIDEPLTGADLALVTSKLAAIEGLEVVSTQGSTYTKMATILDDYRAQVDEKRKEKVGSAARALVHSRLPQPGGGPTYKQGSEMAPVVARAGVISTKTSCLGLVGAGAVRTGIEAGELNYDNMYNVVPFPSTLVEVDIKGEDLVYTINGALKAVKANQVAGGFPYTWGLRYDVNLGSDDKLADNFEANCRMEGDWVAVEPSKVYRVVVTKFLATGSDGYGGFNRVPEDKKLDTGLIALEVILAKLAALEKEGKKLDGVPDEERPIKSYTDTAGCSHTARADCVGGFPDPPGAERSFVV